jgi:Raf kinase inhibitor-like YbhB/YbcL family protein
MAGDYFGYDGPCPPWNDSIPHRYIFTLFALDLEKCPVQRKFKAAEVIKAIKGHVLGSAQLTALYSLNPDVQV